MQHPIDSKRPRPARRAELEHRALATARIPSRSRADKRALRAGAKRRHHLPQTPHEVRNHLVRSFVHLLLNARVCCVLSGARQDAQCDLRITPHRARQARLPFLALRHRARKRRSVYSELLVPDVRLTSAFGGCARCFTSRIKIALNRLARRHARAAFHRTRRDQNSALQVERYARKRFEQEARKPHPDLMKARFALLPCETCFPSPPEPIAPATRSGPAASTCAPARCLPPPNPHSRLCLRGSCSPSFAPHLAPQELPSNVTRTPVPARPPSSR